MVNSKNQNIKLFLKFEVEKSNQIQVFCMGFAANAARFIPDLHCLYSHCGILPKKF